MTSLGYCFANAQYIWGRPQILTIFLKRNPVFLTYIKNIPWESGDITPDYVIGKATWTCALFLRYTADNLSIANWLEPIYIYICILLQSLKYRCMYIAPYFRGPPTYTNHLIRKTIRLPCLSYQKPFTLTTPLLSSLGPLQKLYFTWKHSNPLRTPPPPSFRGTSKLDYSSRIHSVYYIVSA